VFLVTRDYTFLIPTIAGLVSWVVVIVSAVALVVYVLGSAVPRFV
jgi:hypothetical protein